MALDTGHTDDLARLRGQVDRALTLGLWSHVPLVAAVAWLPGNAVFVLGGTAAVVAAVVTLARHFWSAGSVRRIAMGIGAVVMVSLLIAVIMGSAWQIDMHVYYFVVLALLTAYCDRNVILVASAVTAVHHRALNFIAPSPVFTLVEDLGRVFLHAVMLFLEAGTLVWLTGCLARLIATNAANLNEAEDARSRIHVLGQEHRRWRHGELDGGPARVGFRWTSCLGGWFHHAGLAFLNRCESRAIGAKAYAVPAGCLGLV